MAKINNSYFISTIISISENMSDFKIHLRKKKQIIYIFVMKSPRINNMSFLESQGNKFGINFMSQMMSSVSWMNEWLIHIAIVLASLDMTSSPMFYSLDTCSIPYALNELNLYFTIVTYFSNSGSLACDSLFT